MAVGFVTIILLAIALLVATFAVGAIPLYYFDKSEKSKSGQFINILSQFGVGMLLGTSFMLVIPEGVKSCVEHDGNVGLNLLVGFLVVYLLDRLVQVFVSSSDSRFGAFLDTDLSEITSVKDLLTHPKAAIISILKNNVVFALFVHGISDGIALGTTSSNERLLIVVLIAIVIHKIPAVLSLTSLMISKQKLPNWQVIFNLFAFSLSTPLGYIVTSTFNLKHSDTMEWVSGSLLLMSGGSLLYASFTAFVTEDDSHGHDHMNVQQPNDDEFVNHSNFVPLSPLESNDSKSHQNPHADLEQSEPTQQEPEKLPHDKSIYVLAGVFIPVIVSFLISED